ncbi:replication protein [Lonsdalea quercina]|uniref:replication protein n=1 Tax=Lonsdalea quercina TaxID=71657 RepID=UPI0039747248
MANTAEVIKFPGPEPGHEEIRVAELEDGYAKLSNMLLEEYAGADITKRHFKVLLAILRKTYGWNKAMDRISDSQISEIAKLPVKRCNEAKLDLVRMGLVKQQGGMFGPNKNISEWCIPQNKGVPPKLRDKKSPKLRECNPSKQGDTKDTITKDKKESITPIVPAGDGCEKLTAQGGEESAEQPASHDIRTVFSHWQAEHNHPTSKLDQKRRKRINARLEEGFSVAELCKAISGAKYDTWLMGKNPSNKRYDGIETLLRDAAQVEKLRDLDDNEHARAIAAGKYSATTARNLDTLQRWAGGEDNGAPF